MVGERAHQARRQSARRSDGLCGAEHDTLQGKGGRGRRSLRSLSSSAIPFQHAGRYGTRFQNSAVLLSRLVLPPIDISGGPATPLCRIRSGRRPQVCGSTPLACSPLAVDPKRGDGDPMTVPKRLQGSRRDPPGHRHGIWAHRHVIAARGPVRLGLVPATTWSRTSSTRSGSHSGKSPSPQDRRRAVAAAAPHRLSGHSRLAGPTSGASSPAHPDAKVISPSVIRSAGTQRPGHDLFRMDNIGELLHRRHWTFWRSIDRSRALPGRLCSAQSRGAETIARSGCWS